MARHTVCVVGRNTLCLFIFPNRKIKDACIYRAQHFASLSMNIGDPLAPPWVMTLIVNPCGVVAGYGWMALTMPVWSVGEIWCSQLRSRYHL